MSTNVLVVGGGGREHAFLWKLAQSHRIGNLYAAPGNGGTRDIAENIVIGDSDIKSLARFVEKRSIDLTVVGPDNQLASGIVDVFQSRGLRIFGPNRPAAKVEWSKAFAKRLMRDNGIPTAPFQIFKKYERALEYVRVKGVPIVVKASGLALGKGVYPCKTLAEAEVALAEIMLERAHKEAGHEVIVEDFLIGQEVSIHVLCDGRDSVLFPPAKDYKAIYDGGKGKNTGGMGTIVPVPWVSAEIMHGIERQVVHPALKALKKWERSFTGCLYPGIMITADGFKVLEFNARFGDPETQSYMRLLKTDLLDILEACVDGNLAKLTIEWNPGFAVCVVLASGGYPGEYKKGIPVFGLRESERLPGIVIFHAGTAYSDQLRTAGGRVLGVSAIGKTLEQALGLAYEAMNYIKFEGMHFRKDIGKI